MPEEREAEMEQNLNSLVAMIEEPDYSICAYNW